MRDRGMLGLLFALISLWLLTGIAICEVPIIDLPGGNRPIPLLYTNINLSISQTEINRSDEFTLTYDFYNDPLKNDNRDIYNINFSDFISDSFQIIKMDGKELPRPLQSEIILSVDKLPSGRHVTKNWTLCSKRTAKAGYVNVLDLGRRSFGYLDIKWGNHIGYIERKWEYFNKSQNDNKENNELLIKINNNLPRINNASVYITCPNICTENELICWDTNRPLTAVFQASATDVEDLDNLTYNWSVEYSDSGKVYVSDIILSRSRYLNNSLNLDPGRNYFFKVKSIDSEKGISNELQVNITGSNGIGYKNILIPNWEFYLYNTIILFLVIMIMLITFIKSKPKNILTNKLFVYLSQKTPLLHSALSLVCNEPIYGFSQIILATLIYIALLQLNYISIDGIYIYFTSLALYELYVYVLVFIIYTRFIEWVFSGENICNDIIAQDYGLGQKKNDYDAGTKSSLWIINLVIMSVFFWIFYGIISGTPTSLESGVLSRFYPVLLQVSGTLLGIIVGFFAVHISSASYKDTYLSKKLSYFSILYISLMILSILCLTMGTNISFAPLLTFNLHNIPNIIYIALFESTLLLIPPALISLYLLLKSIPK
jgi:hypothetical protein